MVRPDDPYSVERRCQAVWTRRALALLLMGLVLPGAAQIAHGGKRLGRLGYRLWGVVTLLLGLVGLSAWLARGALLTVLGTGWVLQALAVGVALVGAAWLVVWINAWWLTRPARLGPARGLVVTALAVVVAVALVLGAGTLARALAVAGSSISSIFGGGGDVKPKDGRYNILLLGADSGADREGLRPDSITLASVDADSGRTVLMSLPRNLEDVPFPEDSPLHGLYPNGYTCASHECMLNAVYLLGHQHADLYPTADDPGLAATMDAVRGITGLPLNYYAMVNMEGFVALIDAFGGIDMTINQRVPVGTHNQVDWWIEPGPHVHLSGEQALWFARTRVGSDDYDRMRRQKCVMAAMLNQLDPITVATRFTSIAQASGQVLITNVPSGQLGLLAELALKARRLPVASLSFTPPLIHSGSPDFDLIRSLVRAEIERAEALDAGPGPASDPTVAPEPAPTSPTAGDPTGDPANQVDDLQAVCSV
ncbi:MAG: LCP family protein [Propionibacteriaceae bacterium]|nr:LCP family protein [Propionibacteriaceae bacterium]